MENVIYYYVVFFIVILVKLQKFLKREQIETHVINDGYSWLVIFDGLDLAFSAAGVIIYLFLESEPKWYAPIFSLAIFLYFVAFIADSLGNKHIAIKRSLNILVLVIVFTVTYLVFSPGATLCGISLKALQKHNIENKEKRKRFKVVIPYQDLSLVSHLGLNKSNNVFLLYEKTVEDSLESSAIQKTVSMFLNDSSIVPIISNRNIYNVNSPKSSFIKYDEERIYVY